LPLPLPMYNHHHSPLLGPPLHRHPVGTNPHDINNPLSVNQLTGKCIKHHQGHITPPPM
jgi:transcription factor 7-like 2